MKTSRIRIRLLLVVFAASFVALGSGCRESRSDGDGDGDVDGDSDADGDFDEAACTDLNPPLGGDCDPVEQICCQRGERCTVAPDPEAADEMRELCAPNAGGAPHGTVCTADDECGAGTTCFGHPLVAYCARFCAGSGDCPDTPVLTCIGLETTGSVYNVCVPAFAPCDPMAQTGCPDGAACTLEMHAANATPGCFPVGSHLAGEECSDGAGCRPGAGCYESAEGFHCYEYCLLAETCPDDTECLEIGNATYGVCLPPA